MTGHRRSRLLSLVAPIAVWQAAVSTGVVSPSILPPPLVIAEATLGSLGDPSFQGHVVTTLRRTAIASAFASTLGTVIGFAMAANQRVRDVLSPVAAAVFALPTIALFPLLILVLGSTERAIVFTAAIGAFVLVLWNARNGARAVDPVYVDVAVDNGATSRYDLFREVWLPGSLPLVLVGLRLGLSMSLLVVTAVEFVAADSGLGYVLWISWLSYRLPEMYAALVVVGAFGVVITYGLGYLKDWLVPWDADVDRAIVAP